MASEMEQTIDEILSGVQTLLRQARTAPAERSASLGPDEASLPALVHADDTMLLMAVLESEQSHPCALSARRWIIGQLDAQAVALGDLGGQRHAAVRVSPRLHAALAAIVAQGAVLKECDARFLHWLLPTDSGAAVRAAFGRLAPAVCLDQLTDGLWLRVPKIPERLALRFSPQSQKDSSVGMHLANRFARIDQDNSLARPSTLFWLADGGLVPDQLCAIAYHQRQWWPIGPAADSQNPA